MSIWYIKILSVSDKGQITNYMIQERFQDFDELLDWFAYDYKQSNERYVYLTYRYQIVVENQNLTGLDTKIHTEVSSYFPYNVCVTLQLRNIMIYDVTHNKIIDIRKYRQEILSHVPTAKYMTEYYKSHRKSRSKRQYRTHKKHYGYRSSYSNRPSLEKVEKINRTLSRQDFDDDYSVNIKFYRGNSGIYHDYIRTIENNWKQKKIRKQWQYHKSVSCKSHYQYRSKYCDDSWSLDDTEDYS